MQRQRLSRFSKTTANQRLSQRDSDGESLYGSPRSSGGGGGGGGGGNSNGSPSASEDEAEGSPDPPKSSQVRCPMCAAWSRS